jgi:DNA-binding winged helix-turn-helix (wHTH) protein
MLQPPSKSIFFENFRLDRFGLFELDPAGERPMALGSRALDLLLLLAQRQGEIVPKDVILRTVWGGRALEESNLTVQISTLRRVIDRRRLQGSCIQTIPGRGYRFVARVTSSETGSGQSNASRVLLASALKRVMELSVALRITFTIGILLLVTASTHSSDQDVPPRFADFIGGWGGYWGGVLPSNFVVMSVTPNGEFRAVYGWGTSDQVPQIRSAGSVNIMGRVTGDELGWGDPYQGVSFKFTLQPDGTLHGERWDHGVQAGSIIMKKSTRD